MKKLLIILFSFLLLTNFANSESRFGELTEMRDEKMRGKDGQWVRPHPGPFIWNHIESKKGNFFWDDVDQYVVYAQSIIKQYQQLFGLMPIGIKNLAKEKKQKVLLENVLQNI